MVLTIVKGLYHVSLFRANTRITSRTSFLLKGKVALLSVEKSYLTLDM